MAKTIYNYHPQIGEFINEAPADESPLEPGTILLPAFATTDKPPTTSSREVAVFADGQWHVKADWRGVSLFSVVDGGAVTIEEIGRTPAEANATDQAMPSPAHTWHDGVWRLDPIKQSVLLNHAKLQALAAIKTERDRRKMLGFQVGGRWFQSDADSRIQHLGLKDQARDLIAGGGEMGDKLIALGKPIHWKTLDGTMVPVTAQLAFDIVAAAGEFDARLFAAAEAHKDAMENCADPAGYDYSAGWPRSFGE
ncbi:hypothetical protein HNQ59_000692 [Chitinivorax tropicus]|uniref:DUF4376 domain-containing protein n=1 Tax=Chitinivorax tropicus TaxID=714531 RepID=A0A840MFI3_9PROT|nr:DUF4376 domain-containing protein [Chitinivorax tropicus]MBB5017428.1 hypothetical protein [Chitinivorax tropicus]